MNMRKYAALRGGLRHFPANVFAISYAACSVTARLNCVAM